MDLFNVFAWDFQIYLDMDLWWSLYLWWQLQRHSSILLDQKPGMILKHIMLGIWVEAMLRFPASLLIILKEVMSLGVPDADAFPDWFESWSPVFLGKPSWLCLLKTRRVNECSVVNPFSLIFIYQTGSNTVVIIENRCPVSISARYCFVVFSLVLFALKNASSWAVDECGKYLCASWSHYFFA